MEEEKSGEDKFMGIDKFITELIGYHEQIKKLQASEVHYKLLAASLQESLNKYQAVFDQLPQKVFLKDKNSRYLLANANYVQSLGVSLLEISGKTDYDFFPLERAEQSLNGDREVMAKGIPVDGEERFIREGKVFVERAVKAPIRNPSGETVGVLGISWDISDQKASEEGLERRAAEVSRLLEARTNELKEIQGKFQSERAECRRLEEKLKNLEGIFWFLFENTGTAVAVIEDNRVISRVNGEFEKFSGYSRAEVEGVKDWGELINNRHQENMVGATHFPDFDSPDQGGRMFPFRDKENKEKAFSMTAARIPETNKVMVSLTDITKYKQAREELNRVMRQFMELMAEMQRGVKNLDG